MPGYILKKLQGIGVYVLLISNPSIVVNSACSTTTVMMKTLFLEMTRNEFVVQL